MSEKDVSSCVLVDEAEAIILEHQRNPQNRSRATEIFGALLDNKRAGILPEAEGIRALELRDQCVGIIRSIKSLLEEPMPLEEKSRRENDETKALGIRLGFLMDAGISLYDYEDKDPEKLSYYHPVLIAEYASSILASAINECFSFENGNFIKHGEELLSLAKHVDRFIGERMGTMTEEVPNH